MMFDFKRLNEKYHSDAGFNKMVNIFKQLLSEFGFLPSEIREALFYAQYIFEMNKVTKVIQTQEDWEKIETARALMRKCFIDVEAIIDGPPKN